ncbi:MAG: peptidoglycan D,D-transpeptidase FtsI family protein [Gammaproteobacteria bacterium]
MPPPEPKPHGTHPVRRALVALSIALATVALLWRAADLQLFNQRDFLKAQGDERHLRTVASAAHRGKILDRNGAPLAVSTPVNSVWVSPAELLEREARIGELARVLELNAKRLHVRVRENAAREFLYLQRHIDPATAVAVEGLNLPGVHLMQEYRRYYPLGAVAAHVVGVTNVDDVGQEGIELEFESHLKGEPGARRVLRDRYGRAVEEVEYIRAPRPGRDLTLSLDGGVQYLAYRALLAGVKRARARGGSAVVLDVNTGEVLAMVNQPAFNPNNRGDRAQERLRNRAITDLFEPGSTIKPFTVAAALDDGRYTPDTRIDTRPGRMNVDSYTVHDFRNYGVIDVRTLLKKSSNIGAAKIALELEPETLWQTFNQAGFGAATGSGFPGEAYGVLRHFSGWRKSNRVTAAFGYGLSVTAVQLARAYAAIGNGGVAPPVHFLRPDVGAGAQAGAERVMSRRTAVQIIDMLEGVVSADGTGSRGRVEGFRIAGKTGTVRKTKPSGGYYEKRYVALFAGLAPVSRPRVAVVVLIDEPGTEEYYGGQVAAPVFADVVAGAMRGLGIAPDDRKRVTRVVNLSPAAPPRSAPLVPVDGASELADARAPASSETLQ